MNRLHLGGIGLAIALLVALVLPLALRNADHPLAGATTLDVCGLLNEGVLERLAETPVRVEAHLPNEPVDGKPVCTAFLAPATRGDPPRFVWVWVSTQRMLSTGGRPTPTDRYVETWLKESSASGARVIPVKGPWRNAAFISEPNKAHRLALLIDDAGIMVNISGDGVDRDVMQAFGEATARKLRGRK